MNLCPTYLNNLNPEQRKVVEHFNGPILVLAGAGSGKTRVLTHRIAHLVLAHSVNPNKILAVTFTNKATDEMRQRLHDLLGSRANELWVATFHSCCLKILRRNAIALEYRNDFVVYDDNDTKQLIKRLMKEMSIDNKEFSPQYFSSIIDQAKNSFITPEELLSEARSLKAKTAAEVYDRYQKELRLANAMDYGDLLTNTLLLFIQKPNILRNYQEHLHYILVDEFQDTNTIQYRIVKLLAAKHKNLLVVGDDDQSIYAFRGATVANILAYENDFPGTITVKLEQNYRSTANILAVAHAVICKNKGRKEKKLWTDSDAGELIQTHVAYDEDAEAAFVAREIRELQKTGYHLKDIAVFYRTNAQSRALEEAFLSYAIPYRIFGGLKFFDRKEIKDILAYLRLIVSDFDNQAFIRILNTPARGIGAKALQNIADLASAEKISLWQATQVLAQKSAPLHSFIKLIQELRTIAQTTELSKLVAEIINKTGYVSKLEDDPNKENQSRIENLKELEAVARGMEHSADNTFEVIKNFLDRVSLTSSADIIDADTPNSHSGYVSFMTLHLAKGLEFPVVFFTGLEEGLLPHSRSLESLAEIEEERRLCYVGITRAMQRLYFSRAQTRSMFSAGSAFGSGFRLVSRFIYDIPDHYFHHQSGNFCDSSVESDFEMEGSQDVEDSFASFLPNTSKTLKTLQGKLQMAKKLLVPAENLTDELTRGTTRKTANLADIIPGSRIEHPSFGSGVVVSIDTSEECELSNRKVLIKFDQEDYTRKLVLGRARLALV